MSWGRSSAASQSGQDMEEEATGPDERAQQWDQGIDSDPEADDDALDEDYVPSPDEAEDNHEADDDGDDGADEESDDGERPPKRRRILPANVSEIVVQAVAREEQRIRDKLVEYIERQPPRRSSTRPADAPDTGSSSAGILFNAYTSFTERERKIVAHIQSGEGDRKRKAVTRTSLAFTSPALDSADGRKPNKTTIRKGLKAGRAKAGMSQPGTTFGGNWRPTVGVESARLMWDARVLEMLAWLSTLLFAEVSREVSSQEVEAMVVNGRVLVSANEQDAVRAIAAAQLPGLLDRADVLEMLKSDLSRRHATAMGQVLSAVSAQPADESELTEAQRAGIELVAQYEVDSSLLDDEDERNELSDLIATLGNAMLEKKFRCVDGGSPQSAAGLIEDAEYAGQIIVVDAWQRTSATSGKSAVCSHAEQNLLYALVCSGHREGAQVAGKKRPCSGCSLTLRLVDEAGFNVRYNPHPGGQWDGTTYQGLLQIALQLNNYDADGLNRWIVNALADDDLQQFVTLISGDDPPPGIPAKAAIGAQMIDGLKVSTAEGTNSVFLSYSSPDEDENEGEEEDEEERKYGKADKYEKEERKTK